MSCPPGAHEPVEITDPADLPEPATAAEAMAIARGRIAANATARARGWQMLAELCREPSDQLVTDLREGQVAEVLREATAWLGQDTTMVSGALMSLDVFARGAHRRTVEADLDALRDDRAEVADLLGVEALEALPEPMLQLADLCRQEADAWGEGRDEEGKALRARQREVADATLAASLPPVAKAMVEEGIANLTRTLGRLMLAYLSAETGTDYQRAVLGDPRGRSRL